MPKLQAHFSLKPYNTFGINATARWGIVIQTETAALEFIMDNVYVHQPILILGGGSNILLTQDFEGVVLLNRILGKTIVQQTNDHVWLRVGAGENWHELVLHCLTQDWGGIENLSLIPGCVGAAPIQNIGAYGVEIKEVFESLDAIHLETGKTKTFDKDECEFGYRDSVFKRQYKGKYLITHITLKLTRHSHHLNTSYGAVQQELEQQGLSPSIHHISQVICQIRQSKLPDPQEIGNAGSFFKNPVISQEHFADILSQYPRAPHYPQPEDLVKVPAGWLIEQCGWKGRMMGNYGVHDRQALVLINHGGASGKDIFDLSEQILRSVKDRFGIELEREVNVL